LEFCIKIYFVCGEERCFFGFLGVVPGVVLGGFCGGGGGGGFNKFS